MGIQPYVLTENNHMQLTDNYNNWWNGYVVRIQQR